MLQVLQHASAVKGLELSPVDPRSQTFLWEIQPLARS